MANVGSLIVSGISFIGNLFSKKKDREYELEKIKLENQRAAIELEKTKNERKTSQSISNNANNRSNYLLFFAILLGYFIIKKLIK